MCCQKLTCFANNQDSQIHIPPVDSLALPVGSLVVDLVGSDVQMPVACDGEPAKKRLKWTPTLGTEHTSDEAKREILAEQ